MNYEELYKQAMTGNFDAVENLVSAANNSIPEAQFLLSLVYGSVDSPFMDSNLSIEWLKKSAEANYKPAMKMMEEMSPDAKKEFAIDNKNSQEEERADSDGGIGSFKGRIDRTTYFIYSIIFSLALVIILFLIRLIPMDTYNVKRSIEVVFWAELIVELAISYLALANDVKRMHDCGHSGWWVLVPFCPIYLLFKKGENRKNKYGPIPK